MAPKKTKPESKPPYTIKPASEGLSGSQRNFAGALNAAMCDLIHFVDDEAKVVMSFVINGKFYNLKSHTLGYEESAKYLERAAKFQREKLVAEKKEEKRLKEKHMSLRTAMKKHLQAQKQAAAAKKAAVKKPSAK